MLAVIPTKIPKIIRSRSSIFDASVIRGPRCYGKQNSLCTNDYCYFLTHFEYKKYKCLDWKFKKLSDNFKYGAVNLNNSQIEDESDDEKYTPCDNECSMCRCECGLCVYDETCKCNKERYKL